MGKKKPTFDNPPNVEEAKLLKQKRQRLKKEKRALRRQQKNKEHSAVQDETITSSTEDANHETQESKIVVPPVINTSNSGSKKTQMSTAYDALWQNYIPMNAMLVRQPDWYLERPMEKATPSVLVNLAVRKKIKDFAAKIYQNELTQFIKFEENSGDRDMRLRHQILAHGAMKDRVTAHVLQLSEWPVQSLTHLNKLCDFISSNKESQLKEISKSLKDLLSSSLLPKGLVAHQFEDHDFHRILLPLVHSDRQKAYTVLLLWYYEDQLKLLYTKLISALKQVVSTSTTSAKTTAVQMLLGLLGNHPQQETETVLQVLVNKLGDLDKTVAYAVVYGIRNLLIRRPTLKVTLVDICGELLFRPNQRKNTLYNCMQLLKDVFFTKDDVSLVQKMIKLYFGFFKACTKTGEVDGKLMSVILRGLNRALPYATSAKGRAASDFLEEQFDMLYKMVHLAKFNISVQILQLLYQVLVNIEPNRSLPERFERVLYERLLCPELSRCSVIGAFLNLVFKTMSRMTCPFTLKAMTKRLLQVSFYQSSHLAIAMVFVLSETSVDNKLLCSILDELSANESVTASNKMANTSKATTTSPKEDGPQQVVDSLAQRVDSEDDDGDDFFKDIDIENDDKVALAKNKKCKQASVKKSKKSSETSLLISNVSFGESSAEAGKQLASWLHRDKQAADVKTEGKLDNYDAYHRNPKYCGTQFTKVWELRNALNHFHPSMTAFTRSLVERERSKYTGDPLIDYSLIKFLDRFVNKAPKKAVTGKQTGGATALGAKSVYSGQKKRSMCVTSDYFKNLDEDRVPEDAKFFHKYFTSYSLASSRPVKPEDDDDGNVGDDVDDAEFERYLDSAAGRKGVTQDPFKHEDELDDQWDFAANAKGVSRGDEDDDSDVGSFESMDGDEEDDENGGEFDASDEAMRGSDNDEEISDDGGELQDDDEADFGDELDDFDATEDHGHLYLDDEEMEEKPVQNRKKIEQKLKVVAEKNKKAKRDSLKREKEKQNNRKAATEKSFSAKDAAKKGKKDDRKKRKREDLLDGEDDGDWDSLDGADDGVARKAGKMKQLDDLVFGKKKERTARSLDAMMMDADEFSEMLQRNANRPPAITSSDFVNTADISQNQLRWERAHASDSLSVKKDNKKRNFSGGGNRFRGTKARTPADVVHRKGSKLKSRFNKR
ncbi:CCAAT-binding factor [Trinorchestia longiramus]|nr:CCAAT-binding factor [Trinorchestia longiramus]